MPNTNFHGRRHFSGIVGIFIRTFGFFAIIYLGNFLWDQNSESGKANIWNQLKKN